ncbi:MAG: hypothetical protein Kow0062_05990 [Acidobacteriota bacterium]
MAWSSGVPGAILADRLGPRNRSARAARDRHSIPRNMLTLNDLDKKPPALPSSPHRLLPGTGGVRRDRGACYGPRSSAAPAGGTAAPGPGLTGRRTGPIGWPRRDAWSRLFHIVRHRE